MIALRSRVKRSRVSLEPNLNPARQQAHALLDMPPAAKLNAVRRLLALAPVEEGEITPGTAAVPDRARADRGRLVATAT